MCVYYNKCARAAIDSVSNLQITNLCAGICIHEHLKVLKFLACYLHAGQIPVLVEDKKKNKVQGHTPKSISHW